MFDIKTEKPQIVPISYFCSEKTNFYIPSYQRGYRWNEAQIRYLMDDIANFNPVKNGNFYCLQPLVIHYDKEYIEGDRWRLVDGQQRLTTIYLILRTLFSDKDTYEIKFERETKFPDFSNETIELVDDTPENYYLTQACNIIKKWGDENPDKIDYLKDNIIKNDTTRVIWYPIQRSQTNDKEFEFFMHLNSGKISLTDAELVKALFLHDIERGKNIDKTLNQIEMAEEWNRMEAKLREPDFWHFIAGRNTMPACSMDYLLAVHYKSYLKNPDQYKKYPYPAFAWLEDRMTGKDDQSDKNINNLWEDLRNTFSIITGWYENFETYNLIGYHITINNSSEKLIKLLKESRESGMTKKEIIANLWREAVTQIVPAEDIKSIKAGNYEDLEIYDYRYDNKTKLKVFELLTLINIAIYTIGGLQRKFEFQRYNDPLTPWNIEHISPRNPKDNDKLLDYIKKVADDPLIELPQEFKKIQGLIEDLKILEQTDSNNDKINEINKEINEIKRKILPFEDEDIMRLGNLTLLTEHNNKSIGNKFFFEKKQILRNKQREGHYIPQLTQNVFAKWFSKKPDSPLLWDDKDRKDYLDEIASILREIVTYVNKNYVSL